MIDTAGVEPRLVLGRYFSSSADRGRTSASSSARTTLQRLVDERHDSRGPGGSMSPFLDADTRRRWNTRPSARRRRCQGSETAVDDQDGVGMGPRPARMPHGRFFFPCRAPRWTTRLCGRGSAGTYGGSDKASEPSGVTVSRRAARELDDLPPVRPWRWPSSAARTRGVKTITAIAAPTGVGHGRFPWRRCPCTREQARLPGLDESLSPARNSAKSAALLRRAVVDHRPGPWREAPRSARASVLAPSTGTSSSLTTILVARRSFFNPSSRRRRLSRARARRRRSRFRGPRARKEEPQDSA